METSQFIKRDRAATSQRVTDALEQILAEEGLQGVSITALAKRAAVSKVLIYRYFGNIEGLLAYYISQGRMVAHPSSAFLAQFQPAHPRELAPAWSTQALRLFRQYRASRPARAILQATVNTNDTLADAVNKSVDSELSKLVEEVAFIKGDDYQAAAAILVGGLSYLTIQAQLDRPVIGLDLRSEAGWQRIEQAVEVICQAFAQSAIHSPTAHLQLNARPESATQW
ncbi:TetR/AcrR family transcriptional regulator [Spirosoma sp. KNUC1025]|uniref:TetR/AcrR family transcriptional regulator n=1 Tax=Spirosoma sp. KNUC1025 TaxID=2894082 RepID=UPI001E50ADF3|nr:TetR/AcrR family transcriptional regulator [Spirosoma sp. KNUC1025]UFH57646.1 TetR/AcrR family transcriptional regulator [Spirosoma sp. KNUC1025]